MLVETPEISGLEESNPPVHEGAETEVDADPADVRLVFSESFRGLGDSAGVLGN